jgi:hypothetical protein
MTILHLDEDGDPMVRENVILAFFVKRPPQDIAPAIRQVLQRWMTMLPGGAPTHALIGADASSFRKFGKATMARVEGELDPVALAGPRDLAHLRLQASVEIGPDWRFMCSLMREAGDPETPNTNLIEMLFPPAATTDPAAFAAMLREIAAVLPFDSGYAAPGLSWCNDNTQSKAGRIIGPLALRHPGYDVSDNDTTANHLGDRCRGARWITFLGPALVAELGGRATIREALGDEIALEDAGEGLAIQAGAEPEIGDANRKQGTPLLAEVAQVIEPVTFFDDRFLDILFGKDAEKRDAWERRFFAQEG